MYISCCIPCQQRRVPFLLPSNEPSTAMSFARVPFFIELIARALETFSLLVPGKELIREISDGGFDWRIRISRSRIQERYIC